VILTHTEFASLRCRCYQRETIIKRWATVLNELEFVIDCCLIMVEPVDCIDLIMEYEMNLYFFSRGGS